MLIKVYLPKRHLRVKATSDIRQLSELPIDIFNTKLPPSRGNLREEAQNHSPDACRFGSFTCKGKQVCWFGISHLKFSDMNIYCRCSHKVNRFQK